MLDSKLIKFASELESCSTPKLALGISALDDQLSGGLPLGAVTEIVSANGHGGWWLAMHALTRFTGTVAILNHDDSFHPPGAMALGLDLSTALVVQPKTKKDALWSLERLVRSNSLNATLAWLPRIENLEMRRLQLAAERSGQALILLRNERDVGRSSWGALRLKVEAQPGDAQTRRLLIHMLRTRGGRIPQSVLLEISKDRISSIPALTQPQTLNATA